MQLIPNKFDETIAFVVCGSNLISCQITLNPAVGLVRVDSPNQWLNIAYKGSEAYKELPPGDWEICFKHSEAYEDSYELVTERDGAGFKDYTKSLLSDIPYRYAHDSFDSLLRAHGINTNNEIVILKKK